MEQKQIEVFHGTTKSHAYFILQNGLEAETCVTTSEDLAWYYAEAALDEDNEEDNDEAVVRFIVSIDKLQADQEALAEPVGCNGLTGDEISEKLQLSGDFSSLKNSLELCASARLKTFVSADCISLV